MVTIPCGRRMTLSGLTCGVGVICDNCAALRGLLAANEWAADRLQEAIDWLVDDGYGKDEVYATFNPIISRFRAAIAAARPAEEIP